MSVNWNQEWEVTTPGGGLSAGDWIKFDGSQILLKKKGEPDFVNWTSYSSTAPKTRALTLGSSDYTVTYEHNLDKLTCLINSDKLADGDSGTSFASFLSWLFGAIIGAGLGLGTGLVLDVPWGEALIIALVAAFSSAMAGKAANNANPIDHGPSGPSWTAIEGG